MHADKLSQTTAAAGLLRPGVTTPAMSEMTNDTNPTSGATAMRTIDQLVNQEVTYCVSSLVSTIAQSYGSAGVLANPDGSDLAEQAVELCRGIPGYDSAAVEAGAVRKGDMWEDADGHAEASAEDMCDWLGADPYESEVYEHWIVSDWLAEKLAAYGEKVDTDFAGLTIWARTTTGPGIASDSVIERIHADLMAV